MAVDTGWVDLQVLQSIKRVYVRRSWTSYASQLVAGAKNVQVLFPAKMFEVYAQTLKLICQRFIEIPIHKNDGNSMPTESTHKHCNCPVKNRLPQTLNWSCVKVVFDHLSTNQPTKARVRTIH